MTDEQIFEKLEKTYESEGGKKFISHLLRSFFPVNKSEYVWEKKTEPMKCCITGDSLMSKDDAFQAMMDITPEEFSEYLKYSFNPENTEEVDHPIRKKLGKKVLAIECKDSNKFLCKQAFDQLFNFYASKLLSGDSHMKWLSKRMMADSGIKYAKEKVGLDKNEVKTIYKAIDKPKKMTFGDLDVLKNLQSKLSKENN